MNNIYYKFSGVPRGIVISVIIIFLGILAIVGFYFPLHQNRSVFDCLGLKIEGRNSCLESVLVPLVGEVGPEKVFDQIQQQLSVNKIANPIDCHFIAHYIGKGAYLVGKDRAKAINAVADHWKNWCTGGYMHGVLEAYFKDQKDVAIGPELMRQACAEYGDKEIMRPIGTECFHGAGHAFMHAHKNDILTTLNACNKLSHEWQKYWCGYGAFMELFYSNRPTYDFNRPEYSYDIKGLCEILDIRWKESCYFFSGIVLFVTRPSIEYSEVFRKCDSIQEDQYRDWCYIGTFAPLGGRMTTLEEISRVCKKARSYYITTCIINSSLYFLGYSGENNTKALSFCSGLPKIADREQCVNTLKNEPTLHYQFLHH